MALLGPELEGSIHQVSELGPILLKMDSSGANVTEAMLATLQQFWNSGSRHEVLEYFKEYFWKLWFQLDVNQLYEWHSRFCEAGAPLESPLIAGSLLPFLGGGLRFSLAQLANTLLGEGENMLTDMTRRLGSLDSEVVARALSESNDFRNKFDAMTGYRSGSSKYFPRSEGICKVIYDSGLDDFDSSMSVEVVPYYREAAMLETRIEAHAGRFNSTLLVEGVTDYQGKPKPSYFMDVFDDAFRRRNRIRHIIVEFPETDDPWVRDRLQRDAAVPLLAPLDPEAIIFSSDLDELFDVTQLEEYRKICSEGPVAVTSAVIMHCLSNISNTRWMHPKTFFRKHLPESLSAMRLILMKLGPLAGWHLTYFGDSNFIMDKLNAFAHTEKEPDPNEIISSVRNTGVDIASLEIYENLPEVVRRKWSSCTVHSNCDSVFPTR